MFASVLIAISAVLSLVTIISIYREGGILKRLRATPLRPQTILSAHVLVKLLLTRVTLILMVLAGKRYYPVDVTVPLLAFRARAADQHRQHPVDRLRDREHRADRALRAADRRGDPVSDARPVGPVLSARRRCRRRCRRVARVLPLTYAVSLLQGIWKGEAWSAHLGDIAALALVCIVGIAVSARVFRWE